MSPDKVEYLFAVSTSESTKAIVPKAPIDHMQLMTQSDMSQHNTRKKTQSTPSALLMQSARQSTS
jgi:hypothetical protein